MSTSNETQLIQHKDLSVTALYTAHTWAWAGFPYAHVFANQQTKVTFDITNLFIFLTHPIKRPPSLAHSLLQRHYLIDQIVLQAAHPQVLELASGLSARSLRFMSILPDDFTQVEDTLCKQSAPLQTQLKTIASQVRHGTQCKSYFEVDLPHVVQHKQLCIENVLQHTDSTPVESARTSTVVDQSMQPSRTLTDLPITFKAHDLTQDDLIWLPSHPTTVIAEGLCMYLSADEQNTLWRTIYQRLVAIGGGTFVFDLVPNCEQAPPGIMGKFLGFLMRLFTGGKGFTVDQRTRHDIVNELEMIGFEQVHVIDPRDVNTYQEYHIPQFELDTQQLLFVMHV